MEQINFTEAAMQPIYERFLLIFGPEAAPTPTLANDVKVVVWIRMLNALHPMVKPREARLHFLKSFHPDSGIGALTTDEKTEVMKFTSAVFDGD